MWLGSIRAGNLYFVHVFMTDVDPIEKIETDIYVAYKKP